MNFGLLYEQQTFHLRRKVRSGRIRQRSRDLGCQLLAEGPGGPLVGAHLAESKLDSGLVLISELERRDRSEPAEYTFKASEQLFLQTFDQALLPGMPQRAGLDLFRQRLEEVDQLRERTLPTGLLADEHEHLRYFEIASLDGSKVLHLEPVRHRHLQLPYPVYETSGTIPAPPLHCNAKPRPFYLNGFASGSRSVEGSLLL